jgi:hypothetical protein
MKIEGSGSASGSISQRHGSPDPDKQQNVMDPEHCSRLCRRPRKDIIAIAIETGIQNTGKSCC